MEMVIHQIQVEFVSISVVYFEGTFKILTLSVEIAYFKVKMKHQNIMYVCDLSHIKTHFHLSECHQLGLGHYQIACLWLVFCQKLRFNLLNPNISSSLNLQAFQIDRQINKKEKNSLHAFISLFLYSIILHNEIGVY